jgi:glutaredoxin
MTPAVIYSNGSQECERMAALLESFSAEFHKYELGLHFSDKEFRMEFGCEATYPQVSIGQKHIGSMRDTLNYLKINNLI